MQHVAEEGLGCIDYWAQARGHTVTFCKLYEPNYVFPAIESFDWLIILGGPMHVDDTDKHPWLKPEKAFIEQAIKKNKVVFGFCLGAQLIAQILGANVYNMPQPELGWHSVTCTPLANQHEAFNIFPESFIGFHWHYQMFDLPKHGQLIMSSEACKHQAFIYGKRTIAFQFHPEVTQMGVAEFLANDENKNKSAELKDALVENEMHIAAMHEIMRKFLNKINEML
ncbi:MAG TPA: type 1 glutamine amidotransferase [Bacteroidia bacterium]|nr:type 1 glutamine amidotransferase [Bacteroidia bacterium]